MYGAIRCLWFSIYTVCMVHGQLDLHMCKYGAWHNCYQWVSIYRVYMVIAILFLDKFININVFCILLDKRRWQLHV